MAIAVLDIGKTNAKVLLVSEDGRELDARRTPNAVRPGPPYPHFDAEALWAFALDALRSFAPQVRAIVPVTHGACAALLRADGTLALPVLDYEHAPPDMRDGYDPPPFAETGSPPLPGGLNVGVQLHWLERTLPDAFAQTEHLLFWPQWWAFRLTGRMASERTSLGCHTDLWNPHADRPSTLAGTLGRDRLLAPLRHAGETLGTITPDVAEATGLDPATPVLTGIHDSNASLLPYLSRAPCGVLSTGTWVIAMALGGAAVALDPRRDTLLNVAADGRPVPTARFMGGRERDEAIAAGTYRDEADAAVARRAAERLAEIGNRGPIHVEGPFGTSAVFLSTLRQETGVDVHAAGPGAGTTMGAAILASRRSS
ncbi:MAG: FGGY family carbohydrate kinase [Pseudomonadota bacterium]